MRKYILLAAAVAAVACTRSAEIDSIPQKDTFTLSATISPETKTTLDGLHVNWTVKDAISVFIGKTESNPTTANARFNATTADCTSAEFEFAASTTVTEFNTDATSFVAIYPYKSDTYNSYDATTGIATYTMNASQEYVEGSFQAERLPMLAVSTDPKALSFKQLAGILRLDLKGTAKITGITLDAGDQKLRGAATIDTKAETPVVVMSDAAKADLTYTCGDGVQLSSDEATPFYIVLPAQKYESLKITISDDAFGTMEKTATGLEIKRGVITPAALTYSSSATAATDLTAGGKYANCFVISEPGLYCFDPVKPDGTKVEATSAAWVWATSAEWNPSDWSTVTTTDSNYATKLADEVKLLDGKVYVNATMTVTGNMVVGTVGEDGKLTWSWHLWFTKDLADVTYKEITWMDRNLGAGYKADVANNTGTKTNAARGVYYQWGRKDLVIGPHGNGNGTLISAPANGSGTALYQYNKDFSVLTGWAVGTTALSTDVLALNDPLSVVKAANLPNLSETASWPDNANPCPYGYTLPTSDQAKAAMATGNDPLVSVVRNGNSGQYNVGDLSFPIVGYRDLGTAGAPRKEGSATSTSAISARMWTLTGDASNKAYYWRINSTYDSSTTTSAYSSYAVSSVSRQNANSVRCVKK